MREEKIVSIEDRIPKLKQQRKKKANRRLIFYLSLFFILICVIIYLQSPLSYIKDIEVEGNNYLTDDEVINQSTLTTETNIWNIKMTDVTNYILTDPVVKSAKVTRKLPWTVSIKLEEYELVGYVKDEEHFIPLLENGEKITIKDRYAYGDAPLLLNFTDEKILQEMTSQLQQLPPNILRLISEIHWSPNDQNKYKVILYMNDGFIVEGTIRNFADRMHIYPSIASQLDPEVKGIIHIGVGAYFEQFQDDDVKEDVPSGVRENEDNVTDEE